MKNPPNLSRRAWLSSAASAPLLAGAGVAAAQTGPARNLPPDTPQWMRQQGGPFANPPYGLPSKYEKGVLRAVPPGNNPFPAVSRAPLQKMQGILTPNGVFFERHHAGVPDIDPAQHRLMIHGLVERPLLFTMDDIVRFPSITRTHFLECAGNSAAQYRVAAGTTAQEIHGLLSCAQWTGVRLSTVLAEAGVKPQAKWLLAEGADGAALARSIPMEEAMAEGLLVYGQNGEMLRAEQGYPLRLLLPGMEGNMNIKWLRRLKVSDKPFHTKDETSKYSDVLPSGKALEFTFWMDVKSLILSPSGGDKLVRGQFREISGVAWSGRGKIRAVDVSVDGGRNWREAQLEGPVLDKSFTRFSLPWRWDGSPVVIQSRAIDEAGNVQPTRKALLDARGDKFIYHYNAIQSWRIAADGGVTNVHA